MMLEAEKDGKKRDIVMKRSNRNMFCVELVAIENAAREPAVFLHSCFFFLQGCKASRFKRRFASGTAVHILAVFLCFFCFFFLLWTLVHVQ